MFGRYPWRMQQKTQEAEPTEEETRKLLEQLNVTRGETPIERYQRVEKKIPTFRREKYYEKPSFAERVKEVSARGMERLRQIFRRRDPTNAIEPVNEREYQIAYDRVTIILKRVETLLIQISSEFLGIRRGIEEKFRDRKLSAFVRDVYNLYNDICLSLDELRGEVNAIKKKYEQNRSTVTTEELTTTLLPQLSKRLESVQEKAVDDLNALLIISYNQLRLEEAAPGSRHRLRYPETVPNSRATKERIKRLREDEKQRQSRDSRRFRKSMRPKGYASDSKLLKYSNEATAALKEIISFRRNCNERLKQLRELLQALQGVENVAEHTQFINYSIEQMKQWIEMSHDDEHEIRDIDSSFADDVEQFFGVPECSLKRAYGTVYLTRSLFRGLEKRLLNVNTVIEERFKTPQWQPTLGHLFKD